MKMSKILLVSAALSAEHAPFPKFRVDKPNPILEERKKTPKLSKRTK